MACEGIQLSKKTHGASYFTYETAVWLGAESNRRHVDFQSTALPTELPSRGATSIVRRASGFPLCRNVATRQAVEPGWRWKYTSLWNIDLQSIRPAGVQRAVSNGAENITVGRTGQKAYVPRVHSLCRLNFQLQSAA